MNLTDEQKAFLGIIDGPVWPDDCGHGGYVASYECVDRLGGFPEPMKIDIYVFGDARFGECGNVCLRYGRDGEYYSSSGLVNLLGATHLMKPYQMAVLILEALGRFRWVPKEEEGKS